MNAEALLFTLACIGISEAVYLIQKRVDSQNPVCYLGGQCTVVLYSKWNKTFGIHNDVLGLLFYITLAVISALLVIDVGPVLLLQNVALLSVGGAALMSIFFIFLQWKVIKAWCFWCLMSSATVGLMAAITFYEYSFAFLYINPMP